MASVSAKTANKPLIRIRALMRDLSLTQMRFLVMLSGGGMDPRFHVNANDVGHDSSGACVVDKSYPHRHGPRLAHEGVS
jgi:hypothetical protein